ncbi:MAG: hypothetical protein ACXVCE_02345, partial [Bacteriovorax sp.]
MKHLMTLALLLKCTALSASELDATRTQNDFDSCSPQDALEMKSKSIRSFEERIEAWVNYFESSKVSLSMEEINPYYHVSANAALTSLSLSDLHFCSLDRQHLSRSLSNAPDAETIDLLNQFFTVGAPDYKKLFSCLALEESLGDPDTASSKKIYQKVVGKSDKPLGVLFYIDPAQKKESALNIGLYQFTPNGNGNINPCIKSWNKLMKDKKNCEIKSSTDVISALSSPGQNFNAFCGVHKIIETASIQMK